MRLVKNYIVKYIYIYINIVKYFPKFSKGNNFLRLNALPVFKELAVYLYLIRKFNLSEAIHRAILYSFCTVLDYNVYF